MTFKILSIDVLAIENVSIKENKKISFKKYN